MEKRSRFLGSIFPVETEAAAMETIRRLRTEHWDAGHNVYAYRIHGGAERYSDDGEPQGTAGMPILETLRRIGIEDALVVVTRYFGGILLGTGGLTRAYARAARDAVSAGGIAVQRLYQAGNVSCPYPLLTRVKQSLEAANGILQDIQYGAAVELSVLLPIAVADGFSQQICDLSSGTVSCKWLGKQSVPVKIEG